MKSAFDELTQDNLIEISNYVKNSSHGLATREDLDPLIERMGDARVVLLGEASHGSHEFYHWRSLISRRLIEEKGFSFIAVEGDWPDCYEINRFVKGYDPGQTDAVEILKNFKRWPAWMWANWEVKALADWLRSHNASRPQNQKAGFYGLDMYSLWESILTLLDYLEKTDPEAAEKAKSAARCFEPYGYDRMGEYARSTRLTPAGCEDEVVGLLNEIVERAPNHDSDPEAEFNLEQNARVAVNAEGYYRSMLELGPDSWNIRDRHMTDTLDRLLTWHGGGAKAIVWAHNTHIGDARATSMTDRGMINVGQLVREKYGSENTFLTGFGSYQGSVIAGKNWGAEMEKMPVPPARANSWEHILHQVQPADKWLFLNEGFTDRVFTIPLGHRAIGVVYKPDQDHFSNYVPGILPSGYDAFLFFDHSEAVHPIHLQPEGSRTPETFP